jgi:hypothetical protein
MSKPYKVAPQTLNPKPIRIHVDEFNLLTDLINQWIKSIDAFNPLMHLIH